ncbi:MAG: type II toxin-antitoxin system RelE/ParE family toxin [Eggerthellaceae bacterium]|nr:type II toxin-antitoxin system RelE/ParE family toxin [Eggerthellaceae bacterium]
MHKLDMTKTFRRWLEKLKDFGARAAILRRLDRYIATGNLGDYKAVGSGVSEMRIDFGPGYRLYFTRRDGELVLLLVGGDKSSQQRDIEKAIKMKEELDSKGGNQDA